MPAMCPSVGRSLVTMVALAAMLPYCVSQTVKCDSPSVAPGKIMTVTCDFGQDVRKVKPSPPRVTISRSGGTDFLIVDCRWANSKYGCTVNHNRFTVGSGTNITRFMRVYYLNADKNAEQLYLCKRYDQPSFPNTCQFTLGEDDSSSQVDEGWKYAAICLIVLCAILLITNTIALVCCFVLVK